ncbi:unnamed protein product [Protopolystoma xenopodis]|uniref:Uncharacterized protein n=1 Tax=Protopolystoma xenopodis TaxID=117903 RepID=A0A3S5ADX9_9PLAT|nr:unnamed protein product [Protopolystoma xenopodis]
MGSTDGGLIASGRQMLRQRYTLPVNSESVGNSVAVTGVGTDGGVATVPGGKESAGSAGGNAFSRPQVASRRLWLGGAPGHIPRVKEMGLGKSDVGPGLKESHCPQIKQSYKTQKQMREQEPTIKEKGIKIEAGRVHDEEPAVIRRAGSTQMHMAGREKSQMQPQVVGLGQERGHVSQKDMVNSLIKSTKPIF